MFKLLVTFIFLNGSQQIVVADPDYESMARCLNDGRKYFSDLSYIETRPFGKELMQSLKGIEYRCVGE